MNRQQRARPGGRDPFWIGTVASAVGAMLGGAATYVWNDVLTERAGKVEPVTIIKYEPRTSIPMALIQPSSCPIGWAEPAPAILSASLSVSPVETANTTLDTIVVTLSGKPFALQRIM